MGWSVGGGGGGVLKLHMNTIHVTLGESQRVEIARGWGFFTQSGLSVSHIIHRLTHTGIIQRRWVGCSG